MNKGTPSLGALLMYEYKQFQAKYSHIPESLLSDIQDADREQFANGWDAFDVLQARTSLIERAREGHTSWRVQFYSNTRFQLSMFDKGRFCRLTNYLLTEGVKYESQWVDGRSEYCMVVEAKWGNIIEGALLGAAK